MITIEKTRADQLRASSERRAERAQLEKEIEAQEKAEQKSRLRALRLAREAEA
ncbi:hypothetical protein V5T82_09410 [Magnetovibrio sp. PR-2]|uniref:hypothetical protein n=1 Tax=Magnetovibrio sp. PR-2 TaxID=3120356 RepID=UPI002FCE4024